MRSNSVSYGNSEKAIPKDTRLQDYNYVKVFFFQQLQGTLKIACLKTPSC